MGGAEHSMAAGTRGVSAAASDTGSHNEAVAHGSDAHADADGPEAAASSDFKPLDCSAHTDVEALLVRDPDAEEAQPLPPPPPPPPLTQNAMGMTLIFAAQISFSASNSTVAFIGTRVPSLQTTLCRFWTQGAVAVLAIGIRQQGRLGQLRTWLGSPEKLPLFACRGIFGCIALICLYYGLQRMPLADATAINYCNIPLTALVAAVLLGDSFGRLDVACMVHTHTRTHTHTGLLLHRGTTGGAAYISYNINPKP
jgi:drug/metabolite transporter (DMT)-like permease